MTSGRRVAVVAAVAVVLAGGVVLRWPRTGDDSAGDGAAGPRSEPVDAEPGLLAVVDPPTSVRIDYAVESFGGAEPVRTSDRLSLHRPFRSRLETYDGPRPGGEPSSVQISDLGGLENSGQESDRLALAVPPAPGVSDVRLGRSLPDALRDGVVELGERRRVLGHECQVIRTAFALASSDLFTPTSSDSYADTCVDARGIVLEETLVEDGDTLLHRIATAVDVDVTLDDELFETGEPSIATEDGGGFFAEMDPSSRPPGRFFEVGAAPEGFERLGRFLVIPPQAENFNDPLRRGNRLTFVSDVFVRGGDVVVLDQGGTLGHQDPFPDVRGTTVEVDLDSAETSLLTYSRSGPLLLVKRGQGRFLRARGTTTPDVLVDLIGSLEPVDGGEIELLEPDG